jgi:hypothetical protein|tara:strand:- start:5613 stop:5912 length:300 start_codon:yes stop_codon:yes gene_type:complete
MKYTPKGHYRLGYDYVKHKGRVTITTTTNKKANRTLSDIENTFECDIGYVPVGYEHRPDLISDLFYDSPRNDWLILLVNNIEDPFEGLNVGDRILLPRV